MSSPIKDRNKISYKNILFAFVGLIFIFLWILLILDLIFPFKFDFDYSTVITSREGKILKTYLSNDDKWRLEAELAEINPKMKELIIFKEDKYFYYHPGVNVFSIFRAFKQNIFSGEIQSGASTITMQLARMLQPKSRTYANKFIEIFRAFQLELHYSKDEILKLYLNKLPYGGNIEGVRAASLLFFDAEPQVLSLSQSLILSIIPNNPNQLALGKFNERIRKERDLWLENIEQANLFEQSQIQIAKAEPVNPNRRFFRKYASHLSNRIYYADKERGRVQTTINFNLQNGVEELLKSNLQQLKNIGIRNAAVIIYDNQNGEILAYEGSGDFFDKRNHGEVDGVRAYRSPGSALKPLLYGYCFDLGLITPKLVMNDVPLIGEDYAPENFDGNYHGQVTAEQALIASLNIPAVNLMKQVGTKNFVEFLDDNHLSGLVRKNRDLGLSMILGGCEVRLDELTALYSSFARAGYAVIPKYLLKSKKNLLNRRAFSSESSYMIAEILSKPERPDFGLFASSVIGLPPLAFKTGTSQGRRDAWAIGFNERITIGVWLGNFDAAPSQHLTGSNVTIPILFDILRIADKLYPATKLTIAEAPLTRTIDAETGLLPSPLTKIFSEDYYIPGISSVQVSDLYREVEVSTDMKRSYCMICKPESGSVSKVFKIMKPELVSFYEEMKIAYEKIPPHNDACNAYTAKNAPMIIFPLNNSKYFLAEGKGLTFECKTSNLESDIFWYVNDKFFAKSKLNDKVSFIPKQSGKYKISCSDDNGMNSNVNIEIEIY
ncbi:MAG: penicillin-binding protein 1C [Ignavibacteriae bacterium HGW-Ignavibacteriae-1]|jgi:penicillin-binding protein 1C|nr:MAG: penicillin-binding protein 1C [Ignavibacteriae bacterium HGW-Ignavibacteriae-1]